MSTGNRFLLGVLVIALACGLFAAITFAVTKAQTAFTNRGTHARIQARLETSKRERDAATPAALQSGAPQRP